MNIHKFLKPDLHYLLIFIPIAFILELSIGIALGSSIQIALFIAPLIVLLSLFIGPGQMNLGFSRALIGSLFPAVILATMITGDGRSNWYKGVQLIVVYLIIALMFFFLPIQL